MYVSRIVCKCCGSHYCERRLVTVITTDEPSNAWFLVHIWYVIKHFVFGLFGKSDFPKIEKKEMIVCKICGATYEADDYMDKS